MEPKHISVIIPVYNGAKTISKCINSLKEQTLDTCEFIFVDDGSSDNTVETISKLTIDDPRFITLKMGKRTDPFKARKRGVLASTAEYIMFLDADDTFVPQACEVAYKTITRENVDLFIFGSRIVSSKKISEEKLKGYENYLKSEDKIKGHYKTKEECLNLFFKDSGFGFITQLAKKVFSAKILKQVMNSLDSALYLGYGQDLYQLIATMPKINSIYADNTIILHNYFIGVGVTQIEQTHFSIKKFKRIIASYNSYKAIKSFLKHSKINKRLKKNAIFYAKKTLLGSAQKHLCYICDDDFIKCLFMLKKAWGKDYLQNFPNVDMQNALRIEHLIINNPSIPIKMKKDFMQAIPRLNTEQNKILIDKTPSIFKKFFHKIQIF